MQLCLQFEIPDVADRVSEGYAALKIERDPGGGFVEISHSTNRPPLRDVVEKYVFQDSDGALTATYRAVLIKVDGTEYPTPIASSSVFEDSYTTLQNIRDEGVLATDVDDDRVSKFIGYANRYIERATQNWFNPRYQIFLMSGEDDGRLFFDVPIIALQKITINDQADQFKNIEINNRYLRNGMISPDDRKNPMIAYSDGFLIEPGERLETLGGGFFPHDRQQIKVWGIFGFTELPRGTVCGETAEKSQVPLEYGQVPALIEWCATSIVVARCFPMLSDDAIQASMSSRITKLKTMDEEVNFGNASSSEVINTQGFSNNSVVDQILSTYKVPMKMRFV